MSRFPNPHQHQALEAGHSADAGFSVQDLTVGGNSPSASGTLFAIFEERKLEGTLNETAISAHWRKAIESLAFDLPTLKESSFGIVEVRQRLERLFDGVIDPLLQYESLRTKQLAIETNLGPHDHTRSGEVVPEEISVARIAVYNAAIRLLHFQEVVNDFSGMTGWAYLQKECLKVLVPLALTDPCPAAFCAALSDPALPISTYATGPITEIARATRSLEGRRADDTLLDETQRAGVKMRTDLVAHVTSAASKLIQDPERQRLMVACLKEFGADSKGALGYLVRSGELASEVEVLALAHWITPEKKA
ncbi:MAG: hypothetical protein J0M12_06910 [Deltaproteobacteria bacterium]|nr:hypothetical protein [Deltaproteobacteria bacterium]